MTTQQNPLGAQMPKAFLGEDIIADLQKTRIRTDIFASYARPDLRSRDRSLMNIAMLIALNRGEELKLHLRAAAHNGLSKEEICEACRHAMIYCGVAAGRDALMAASEIFGDSQDKK